MTATYVKFERNFRIYLKYKERKINFIKAKEKQIVSSRLIRPTDYNFVVIVFLQGRVDVNGSDKEKKIYKTCSI